MKIPKKVNIMGITYTVREVEVVQLYEPLIGQINYITCEILLDEALAPDKKQQVLFHEIFHGILAGLGLDNLNEDDGKVQAIATALHQTLLPLFESED